MAFATTSDGVRLFYESAGQGTPIVFVHEFGGNHWSWEPQVSYFSRRHQCITYAARGYPPSDVPEKVEQYSQARAADDIVDIMDAAGIEKAHIVGLSMGAFACLHAALRHPDRVLSAVVAGAGYGSEKRTAGGLPPELGAGRKGLRGAGRGGVCPHLRRECVARSVPGEGSSRLDAVRREAREALRARGCQHHARRPDATSLPLRPEG